MDLKDIIQARENELAAAAAQRDIQRVLSLYSPDAQLMPANLPSFHGHEGIAAFFQNLPAAVTELRFTTTEVSGAGDYAYEVGHFALLAAGAGQAEPAVADQGRYLVVWRRINGQWYFHRDMFNHDRPAS